MLKLMTSLPSSQQRAFTFIELMITIAVMVISLMIGITNYLRFLDKQRLYQSGAIIEAMIKDARVKAQNGFLGNEEIGFCTKLGAVEVFSSLTTEERVNVTAQLLCADNSVLVYDNYLIDNDQTTIDSQFKVSFLPLRGAIITLAGNSIASGSATLSRDSAEVLFNLDQGGAIDVKYQ